jgi:hypothetical protein
MDPSDRRRARRLAGAEIPSRDRSRFKSLVQFAQADIQFRPYGQQAVWGCQRPRSSI